MARRETCLREQKPEGARADVRRHQILSAAARCFRERGFHGASVSQISKAAGMSAGHMYHYFENKEAIILSEIVDQDLEHRLRVDREPSSFGREQSSGPAGTHRRGRWLGSSTAMRRP